VSEDNKTHLDHSVRDLIRIKAARLIRGHIVSHSDREDVEQTLVLELLRRLKGFDGSRSDLTTFVRAAIHHAVSDFVRSQKAAKRGKGQTSSIEQLPTDTRVLSRVDGELASADTTLDMQELLRRLPAELKRVAELLEVESVTETARRLGVGRGTVYRRLLEIREFCERPGLRKYLPISSDSSRADGVTNL
jgi:RNA polymerase sigma-70 factor (ECF subfamily)